MDSHRRGSIRSNSSTSTAHSSSSESFWSSTSRSHSASERKGSKSRFFSSIKEWVSTSEPSTQALRQHKMATYHKAGVALDDPRANAKLHIPLGGIPEDAIKPYGRGAEPEEAVIRAMAEKRKARGSCSGSRSSGSYSTHSTQQQFSRDVNSKVAPFNFDRPDPFAPGR